MTWTLVILEQAWPIDYGVTSYQTFLTKYVQITHLFGVLWAFFYQRRTKYFPELQFPDRQQFVAGKEANFLFRFLSVYRTPFWFSLTDCPVHPLILIPREQLGKVWFTQANHLVRVWSPSPYLPFMSLTGRPAGVGGKGGWEGEGILPFMANTGSKGVPFF